MRIWRPACSAARRKASRSPAATYLLAPSNMHPHAGEGREGPGPARDNRNTGDFRAWKDHDAYISAPLSGCCATCASKSMKIADNREPSRLIGQKLVERGDFGLDR